MSWYQIGSQIALIVKVIIFVVKLATLVVKVYVFVVKLATLVAKMALLIVNRLIGMLLHSLRRVITRVKHIY